MSKYIKLFNTQAEYDAWAATYDEGYPVSAYILSENSINGVQYTPFLNAVVDEDEFGYDAATTGLHIDSNVNWTITAPAWITPAVDAGTCKADVVLTITKNNNSDSRTGNVVITFNTTETLVFPFEQEGNPNASAPGDEIWYITSNGQAADIQEWSIMAGDAQMISNTYSGGKGIIKFDKDLTSLESFDGGWPATITSITLSSTITRLGEEWGMGGLNCQELNFVALPDGLETIGERFFAQTQLTGITIPDTVQMIGMDAFQGCMMSISNFVCPAALDPEGNNYWGAVLYDYVTSDGLVIKGNTVVKALDNTITTATIPSGVTVIGEQVFQSCSSLLSIDLSSVTSIGSSAFYGCGSLASVDLSSCTTIGENAFYGCSSLTSIDLSSVTSIGSYAFSGCIMPTSNFVCPEYLNPEGNNYWGAVLYDYATEDGLAIKGNTVVKALDNTITTATIPSGVTVIGDQAFKSCRSLTSIDLSSVTSIGQQAFQSCSGLTSIGDLSSVITIGDSAFRECRSLVSVGDLSNCITITKYAFYYCSSLTSVNLPSSVTIIGSSAFELCSGLTSVTINNTTPPTIGSSVFNLTNNCPIYVPASAVNTYKAASGWSAYKNRIQAIQ